MARWMALLLVAAGIVLAAGCSSKKSLIQLREEGQRFLERQRYSEAQHSFAQVLEVKPEDAEANYGLGRALLAQGDAMRARTHLGIAYQQSSHDANLTFEIGSALAEAMALSGDKQGMVMFLRDAAQSRGEVRDYLLWGDMAAKYGDPDSAELAYRTAVRIERTPTVLPYWKLALFYEGIGKTEAATHRLRQAYAIEQDNPQIIEKLQSYYAVVGPSLKIAPDR